MPTPWKLPLVAVAACLMACTPVVAAPPAKSSGPASDESLQLKGWKLVWNDEFSGSKIDTGKWSVCERGKSDWNNTMSPDPRCYVLKNGILQLRGFPNDRKDKDPVDFLTGGLESKGHPIAATGIANIWEVCHHLRGEAGDRQIQGAKVGLAHVIGLGSACGVHILERSGL